MSRYPDVFRNTLMAPHQMAVSCKVEYAGTERGQLAVIGGSVTADRTSSVRRTCDISVDPTQVWEGPLAGYLRPYGARLRVERGLRYADGTLEMYPVFYGRIEMVESSIQTLHIRCSDLGADVIDARFPNTMTPERLTGGSPTMPIVDAVTALIREVHPSVDVDISKVSAVDRTQPVRRGTSWQQERGDALNELCTQLGGTTPGSLAGYEWYADPEGRFHIDPLPAVIPPTAPVAWIVDQGDQGVLVERTATVDRTNVYNGIVVTSEPVGGVMPAYGDAYQASGDLAWGGPFGKVVQFYTGQHVNTTAAAEALADNLLANSVSEARSCQVTCVPNPKLRLSDVVRLFAGEHLDEMTYIQNMSMPLDPESPMTMTLFQSMEAVPATLDRRRRFRPARRRIPEEAQWRPTRSTSSTRSSR